MTSVHDFTARAADGSQVRLSDYAGRPLLIVNVASKCGLTPQYEGLEALYREFRDTGLEVLAFPCNQFRGQEPGTDNEIAEFCRVTYDVTFPVLAKTDVNGPDAPPLYEFLRTEAPGDWGPRYGAFYERLKDVSPATQPGDIAWNFTKFFIDREGRVVRRYEPPVPPAEIAADLQAALR